MGNRYKPVTYRLVLYFFFLNAKWQILTYTDVSICHFLFNNTSIISLKQTNNKIMKTLLLFILIFTVTPNPKMLIMEEYIYGMADLTIYQYDSEINYMKNITYDKTIIKKIIPDTSNININIPGKYKIIYTIYPQNTQYSITIITKTVTVIPISGANHNNSSKIN